MLFLSFLLLAQNYKKRTPEEKARYFTDQLKNEIFLTDSQDSLIYATNLIVSRHFDSLKEANLSQQDYRKASVQLFKYRDSCFKQILTKKQYLQFDDLQREWREKKQKEKQAKESNN
jgi:hypothetical protein